jgi:hypothetical protein
MKPVRSHWLAFVTGAVALMTVMTLQALVAWQEFTGAKVLLAEAAMALAAIAFFLLANPRFKFVNLTLFSAIRQASAGLGFAVIALLSCFAPANLYNSYYQPFALENLDSGIKFHQDTAFHSALIQSILNFGYPSIAQHGTPVTFYYTLSHYLDAFACWISGLNPYLSAGLLFHFKKLILILIITWFIAQVTRGKSALFRSLAYILLLPVFVGTWTIIGSEGLWSATAVILVSAPRVYQILRNATPSTKQYLYLTLVLFLIGFGKFSSGLMIALFIGLMLLPIQFKTRKFWFFSVSWLAMYSVMAYLFSISNTTAPVATSLLNTLNFLSIVNAERSMKCLIALYVLLLLFGLLSREYRTETIRRFARTLFAAFGVLALLASHFAKTDLFYFTFGLLFAALVFGIQILFENLKVEFKNRKSLAIAAILVLCTAAIPQTTLHLLGSTPKDLKSAIHKANYGFFENLNSETGTKSTFVTLLKGAKLPHVQPGPMQKFLVAFENFTQQNHLNAHNAVLYIPKHIFQDETSYLKGRYWAKGMLFYSLTGIPLIHGSPVLWLGYGFGNYSESDLWTNTAKDLNQICSGGKSVITVSDFSNPTFTVTSCSTGQ